MSDDNHSRDERADVFVHPDYVRAAVSAIQAAHAGGSRSVEFFDEVRIGLSAALPLALAVLREQLAAANARAEEAAAKVARKDQVLSLVVAMKRRAEWQRDEAKEQVAELHTWRGVMTLLDEHYPADVQLGDPTDPGPRILTLTREVDRLRAQLDALGKVTDDMVTAAWEAMGWERAPYMARVSNFTREQIDNGELREADNAATAANDNLMRTTLAAALAAAPWRKAPDAAADGHGATQAGGDRHGETTTTPDGTGTGTTHA